MRSETNSGSIAAARRARPRSERVPLLVGTLERFDESWWSDSGGEWGESGRRSARMKISLRDGRGTVLRELTFTGDPGESTGVRIPLGARRCEIRFETPLGDGQWEARRCETVPVRLLAPGHFRRLGAKGARGARTFLAKASWFLLRKTLRICPALVRPWFDRWWREFYEASAAEGPRSHWRNGISPFARCRLWLHTLVDDRRIGTLYQYETGEGPEYDELPKLAGAASLPKLTVVTPSYNQGKFLGATMDSVLDCPGIQVDYIVMDGGSKDESAELIRERAARLKHWQSKPDKGQAAAIREGFEHTECGPDDVMAYLNSDDLFAPGAVEFVLRWFAANPEVDAVYGHRLIVDENGMEVGRWVLPPHDPEVLGLVDFVPQETLFWRRRIHDAVGGFDPTFQFAMDWDFLLRIRNAGARIERLPWFLGCFRVHHEQKTHTNIESVGAEEVALLRRRENGGFAPETKAVHEAVMITQVESAWYRAKIAEGIRL